MGCFRAVCPSQSSEQRWHSIPSVDIVLEEVVFIFQPRYDLSSSRWKEQDTSEKFGCSSTRTWGREMARSVLD